MASEITICSNALLQLGQNTISSFDEGTDLAKLCSNLWADTRDSILRIHPWNCSTRRLALAPSATAPVYGFAFAFDMPGDLLRLFEADTAGSHKVEGRKILADENPLYIKYGWRNEDVASYDTLLIETLTAAMMVKLAYPLTKSTSQVQASVTLFDFWFSQAKSVDAQEDTPDQIGRSSLTNVRRSGGGGNVGG